MAGPDQKKYYAPQLGVTADGKPIIFGSFTENQNEADSLRYGLQQGYQNDLQLAEAGEGYQFARSKTDGIVYELQSGGEVVELMPLKPQDQILDR